MKARNVSFNDMHNAMEIVNNKYEGNIQWNRFERNGSGYNFTLRCISSKAPGHRRGLYGKRMISACWHVHGDFFDALMEVQPKAVIRISGNKTVYKENDKVIGNWQDWNIGSMYQPLYYSEACDCDSE